MSPANFDGRVQYEPRLKAVSRSGTTQLNKLMAKPVTRSISILGQALVSVRSQKLAYFSLMLTGAAATHYAYFPGILVADSSEQFLEALTFTYSDWHPTIFALIWSVTNKFIAGPEGMFLLELVLYWGGFFLVGVSIIDRQSSGGALWKRLGICLLPFAPFLINKGGNIEKDVLVFGCFMSALGLILTRPADSGIWSWRSVLIYALLVIGSLARHNSVIAAVPLVVLHIWPKAPSVRRIRILLRRGLVVSVLSILIVFGAGKAIDSWVVRATKIHIENSIFLFDLVGISYRLNQNIVPGNWSDDETRKILNSCYSPSDWNSLAPFGGCPFVYHHLVESGIWNRGLFLPWARAVMTHPVYYAAHRLAYLHTLFWPQSTFTTEPHPISYEFGFNENWLFKAIRSLLGTMKRQFPFWLVLTVGFWITMSCLLAGALLVRYLKHATEDYADLLVALSAALYSAPLVVIGPGGDYRYIYWSAGAACVATLLTTRRRELQVSANIARYRG